MELSKFCPRCGRSRELFGEEKKLCADCYTEVNDLAELPDKMEITTCSVCGRMRHKGEWVEAYTVEDQLARKFEDLSDDFNLEIQFWEENDSFKVRLHLEDGPLKDTEDTEIEWIEEQCHDCSKFEGGFYKAKIQLRGETDEASSFIVDRAAELTNRNRGDFLSNIDEVHGGLDFYLSTEKMNRKILSDLRDRFDPEIERSYELVGERDGEEVYRNVVSVRIE